ncbi:MAG: SGNH/GDSL hydrolase family protein, partial [Pseudomonadota bacterium]|nr:SGNH/GDSL hydrolase family protein [Pseudomonadota bacterium]
MNHLALLGDSIFDNLAYVAPAPDVVRQLRVRLGPEWKATLLAVDGHVTADVHRQLDRLPEDATHLVVSVGGNDALGSSSILAERANSVAEAVGRLAEAQSRFRGEYGRMVDAVLAKRLPTALCTIYDASYPEPERRLVIAGLALFNDVISRAAFRHRLPLIDLRLIFTEPADYANPIEPSAQGGEK